MNFKAADFRPSRGDWLQFGAIALALFALYAATSPRTIELEDDGLFVLSSYFLGVEHPPGYPLFTLLGHLMTQLPFGTVAYRVHLLSALFGALSCATLWLCTRQLIAGLWPAYVAALGLAVSPAYWSQAVIAEVYTFNTLFLLALMFMGLQVALDGRGAREARHALPAMALVFGLSLANHWPLMLLTAPGFAVLLWPRREEIQRRLPLLAGLFALGLAPPYLWLVVRSWAPLPISFYGPIDSWSDFWFFLSRAGYARVDVSTTATWIDRIRFFEFFGAELLAQFALAGAALALAGFVVQWRAWGRGIAGFLSVAFLGPSALLLLLLGFDYDALHKHMFHVYPLPSYAIAAIWMALGFRWAADGLRLPRAAEAAAAAALLALMLAVGSRGDFKGSSEWAARYARTLFDALPPKAIVIARGEWDLVPLAYLQLIEGRRPDLTLIQPQGLILGNRIFSPGRFPEEAEKAELRRHVDAEREAIAVTTFAENLLADYPLRSHWLYATLEKPPASSPAAFDVPEAFVRFFEEDVLAPRETDPWTASLQGELRRRYARLLAASLEPGQAPDPRFRRQIEALAGDIYGELGLAEGWLANPRGYAPAQVLALLETVQGRMPSDAGKNYRARFFELRAYLRLGQHDERGATEDLETAVSLLPQPANPAVRALADQYAKAGNGAALDALRARIGIRAAPP